VWSAATRLVVGEAEARLVEEAAIDLVDDFEVAGQHPTEQGQGPALECLWQKRMVRVAKGLGGDLPRCRPLDVVLVDQDAHQLWDGERRMRIVELNRVLLVEKQNGFGALHVNAHHVLERARHEEVLLLEPQDLAGLGLVVRVEHLGEVLADDLFLHGTQVVAHVERLKVEGLAGRGFP